jgi:prepilin-type N-terminal cleavage/methylation domain-containing protein
MDKKGFTLIELLVVIAIIGLLSSMSVYAINVARMKARDAKRLADMRQIQTALNFYHDDHGAWPEENSSNGSWEDSYEDGGDFIDFLKDEGYMSEVPVDPMNTFPYYYSYYVYSAGAYGCSSSEGEYYVLGIRNMETTSRPHPDSPGWSCPDRNWQGAFDWVTGRFER